MAASTRAEIPAETAAAHRSHYEPALLLESIHPHPKNIRHDATADQELVDSILEQGLLEPLLVAPHPDQKLGGYILVAGHRRRDGLTKAGYTHAPAIIREDLVDEADQVAAMLVENGRRADLTPLEEAEGYGQLRFDFGWKPGDIARKAGHSVETVNKRLKLLKLDGKVQTTLHDGQLSLDDAIAISEFPAADQRKLAKAAGTSNFRWELEQAKTRRKQKMKYDRDVAKLKGEGVPERKLPAGVTGVWGLTADKHGMVPLSQTFSRDHGDHPGCLAWTTEKNFYGSPTIEYVCTDIASHDEQLDDQRRAARQAEEEENRAREERRQAEAIARNLRLDAILDSIKPGIKIDPALAAFLAAVTPRMIADLDDRAQQYYAALYEIPEDACWSNRSYSRKKADVEKFRAHVDPLLAGPPHKLLRAFLAAIACKTEAWRIDRLAWDASNTHPWERLTLDDALAWFALAERAGHQLTPLELEQRATARGDDQDAEADQ